MRLITIILLVFCCQFTSADPWCDSVNIGLHSIHFDQTQKHRERNQGLGCRNAFNSNIDYLYFFNSSWKHSLAITKFHKWRQSGRWVLGWDYGFAFGYHIPLIVAGRAQYRTKHIYINFYLLATEAVAAGPEFPLSP